MVEHKKDQENIEQDLDWFQKKGLTIITIILWLFFVALGCLIGYAFYTHTTLW
jgi:predicted negative regulator of RcsB-dependent stress response